MATVSMQETPLDSSYRDNDRLVTLASILLVSLMLACVSISAVQLGQALFPGWQGGHLMPLAFLVALEAMYAQRAIRHYSLFSSEWLLYRLSEWIFILIVLKLAEYTARGSAALLTDIPLWVQDFKTYFFTADYLIACSLILLIWGLSTEFAGLLSKLEVNERLLAQEREAGISEDRGSLRQQLLTLIMVVGAGLIVMTTLLRSDWQFIWKDRPPLQVGTANLLLYFILALLLLSLTQFSLLRIHWSFEEISINRDLAKRWIYYSLVFLILLVSVASLLPTQYTIGLLDVLGLLASLLVNLLTLLAFLLLLPISILFNFFMSLFNAGEESPQMNVQPPPDLIPVQPTGNSWLDLVASIIFWLIFIGVIGFAFFYYLQQRKDIWNYFRHTPFLERLSHFWRVVKNWLRGVNQGIGAVVDAGMQRIRSFRSTRQGSEGLPGFIRLRRLTARQRVYFYYLAMLRRSGERGVSRHPDQTPYEYARELSDWVPEARDEVSSLTNVFVEARYSLHEVTQQHAGRVRQSWIRIKKVLKSAFKRS
jgi:hypothetical protein